MAFRSLGKLATKALTAASRETTNFVPEVRFSSSKLAAFRIRVETKIFKDFGGTLCVEFIIGWEPVSTVIYPERRYKIMDPVSAAGPPTKSSKNL